MKFLDYFHKAERALKYALFAKHRHGHGIHSPFVYDFITSVLDKHAENQTFNGVKKLRNELLKNEEMVSYEDPGVGSTNNLGHTRKISNIARYSSTPNKYGRVLYNMVEKYKPLSIIELGTSLGIGTLYLSGPNVGRVTTLEGAEPLARVAENNFKLLRKNNISLIEGLFELILPSVLNEIDSVDLVYFDGNHSFDATWDYFSQCLKKSHNDSIFIFDDIHWSDEMELVWQEIIKSKEVKVSIDLFRMGIVFFKKELSKQNFIIKY